MKQPQSFIVDIYLQLQLHHKRIEVDVVSDEKLHGYALSWPAEPPFVEQDPHPTEHSLRCWLERRGISLPAFKILEIVASLASTNSRDPSPRPELALSVPASKQL